jgi:hypothetical protein
MKDHEHMSETPETQATVPEGTPTIKGVCLIEIWRTGGNKAPSVFWREVQADGTFSLWRFMEPAFAKKALKAQRFTLDKDGHEVQYAARAFDSAKKATIEDYQRVRKLQAAFRECSDPVLLCRACQGSKEIQATRPLPGGKVLRVVCECPECAPQPPKLDADEGTTSTAEEITRMNADGSMTGTVP